MECIWRNIVMIEVELTVWVGMPLPVEGVVLPDVVLTLRHQQRVADVSVVQVLQQHALHRTEAGADHRSTQQELIYL